MSRPLFLASGDPVLFLLLAGVLVLAGTAIGLGIAGVILLFGRTVEKKRMGRRLLAAGLIPIVVAAVGWILVVGID